MSSAVSSALNSTVPCEPFTAYDITFEGCYAWCPNHPLDNCVRCKCKGCPFCVKPPPAAPPPLPPLRPSPAPHTPSPPPLFVPAAPQTPPPLTTAPSPQLPRVPQPPPFPQPPPAIPPLLTIDETGLADISAGAEGGHGWVLLASCGLFLAVCAFCWLCYWLRVRPRAARASRHCPGRAPAQAEAAESSQCRWTQPLKMAARSTNLAPLPRGLPRVIITSSREAPVAPLPTRSTSDGSSPRRSVRGALHKRRPSHELASLCGGAAASHLVDSTTSRQRPHATIASWPRHLGSRRAVVHPTHGQQADDDLSVRQANGQPDDELPTGHHGASLFRAAATPICHTISGESAG